MSLAKTFNTYIYHNNTGDVPRKLLVAIMLYVLQSGVPSKIKPLPMDLIKKWFNPAMKVATDKEPGWYCSL